MDASSESGRMQRNLARNMAAPGRRRTLNDSEPAWRSCSERRNGRSGAQAPLLSHRGPTCPGTSPPTSGPRAWSWGGWIRTIIAGFKVRSSTSRHSGALGCEPLEAAFLGVVFHTVSHGRHSVESYPDVEGYAVCPTFGGCSNVRRA